jgi:L-arabinokinase
LAAPRLLFYVSGHGFGHATRIRALIAALAARAPAGLEVHVRTEAPHWIFRERDAGVTCTAAPVDVGVLQHSGMDVDLAGTLAAHEAFIADWENAVAREARFIEGLGPSLVVADIPPLAFAAAHRAGVPAVGVANFSWDWILARYAADEPRWAPIAERYREAYSQAERLYRLPLHADLSAFREVVDAPFLVNRSRSGRAACRAALGVPRDDPRPLVLVSFGGFACGPVASEANDELADFRFAMVGEKPAGVGGAWIEIPSPSPVPHEDLMCACDAVIGKTGYGTVAEALAHGVRFLYLPREGFPEVPILEAGLARLGCARPMPRSDFEAGRWRRHLDALFALPNTTSPPPTDGAELIADALLERIGVVSDLG